MFFLLFKKEILVELFELIQQCHDNNPHSASIPYQGSLVLPLYSQAHHLCPSPAPGNHWPILHLHNYIISWTSHKRNHIFYTLLKLDFFSLGIHVVCINSLILFINELYVIVFHSVSTTHSLKIIWIISRFCLLQWNC